MTSSLTFSITCAASPATSASSTGARYRFQNRNNSPRLAVVEPTCPNKLALGSQNWRSKHSTTLFRFPKPRRLMAVTFQGGSGGEKVTVLGGWVAGAEGGATHCFITPRGSVHSTAQPWMVSGLPWLRAQEVVTVTPWSS